MNHNIKHFSERKSTFYLGISKVALFENTSCVFSMEILLTTNFFLLTPLFFKKSVSSYFLCQAVSEKQRIHLKAFFKNLTALPDFISLTIYKLVTQ